MTECPNCDMHGRETKMCVGRKCPECDHVDRDDYCRCDYCAAKRGDDVRRAST